MRGTNTRPYTIIAHRTLDTETRTSEPVESVCTLFPWQMTGTVILREHGHLDNKQV